MSENLKAFVVVLSVLLVIVSGIGYFEYDRRRSIAEHEARYAEMEKPLTADEARELKKKADENYVREALIKIRHLASEGQTRYSDYLRKREDAEKFAHAIAKYGFKATVYVHFKGEPDELYELVVEW
jgi:hypothetical protein